MKENYFKQNGKKSLMRTQNQVINKLKIHWIMWRLEQELSFSHVKHSIFQNKKMCYWCIMDEVAVALISCVLVLHKIFSPLLFFCFLFFSFLDGPGKEKMPWKMCRWPHATVPKDAEKVMRWGTHQHMFCHEPGGATIICQQWSPSSHHGLLDGFPVPHVAFPLAVGGWRSPANAHIKLSIW